jgi:hypothetical protein
MNNLSVVVTTIQEPTEAMGTWAEALAVFDAPLIVVGDMKGPKEYPLADAFLDYGLQENAKWKLAKLGLPSNTYQRKMFGYLYAMETGAMSIYETDDDNAPLSHWSPRVPFGSAVRARGGKWTNPYALFTDDFIWPRGFPPERIGSQEDMIPIWEDGGRSRSYYAPIQQGLANGSPDVDAMWRLTFGWQEPFDFKLATNSSFEVAPGSFAPFNSQSTWWWPECFSMMYLPVTVGWRVSDIWRGLVAQRCMWERDHGIVFHAPEVYQDRNEHDLLVDFREETLVYLEVGRAAEVLRDVELTNYVSHRSNIVDCYLALVKAGLVAQLEMPYLYAWLQDVKGILDRREEQ